MNTNFSLVLHMFKMCNNPERFIASFKWIETDVTASDSLSYDSRLFKEKPLDKDLRADGLKLSLSSNRLVLTEFQELFIPD